MKRKLLSVAVLAIAITGLLGCQKETIEDIPIESETASFEEVSEEVSEEIVSEIIDGVQKVRFDTYDELKDFANSTGDTYSFFDAAGLDNPMM